MATPRPFIPMTSQWRSEFVSPRGPKNVPQPGQPAPDFELPYARYFVNDQGEEQVEYGKTMRLSDFEGRPVILNLTRIVSDRFF
jgi:hypothetical protein